ncbi:IS1249 family transposase [Arcanobacterium pluranimalium]|uniref:IS1249 family transposase n=1 Tax=Arcanobacterium pluranimalium TaxID=108028 RepID=UPI00195EB117|nr:IS1249 family transposase [Arcanobacterium pluranimalium]
MGNPRCSLCGSVTQKWGKSGSGRPRFRCPSCRASQSRSNDVTARYFAAFLNFVTSDLRYRDLPGQGRNARRRFHQFWQLWPVSPVVEEVHHVVFVDGIYLSRKLVVLIACTKTHVLGWYVARRETTAAWQALFSRIAPPDVVVCDGGPGIASAVKISWPTTRIQRCVFHAFSTVKRYTTSRPRTRAGVELYGLAKDLLHIHTREEALAWMGQLAVWNTAWKAFLAEKTRLANGQIVPTHARLIRAKNSLNTLVRHGTLFTYLDPSLSIDDDPIPATSNLIESLNSRLRHVLRSHRGMPIDHQVKTILWWCYQHTEFPNTPAQLLETTYTDSQIEAMFTRASHHHAQEEIQRWGTAVNWTDFHHNGQWQGPV